jgi:hypothetical protein
MKLKPSAQCVQNELDHAVKNICGLNRDVPFKSYGKQAFTPLVPGRTLAEIVGKK